MNQDLELCVIYKDNRKLIIYEYNTSFCQFKEILKDEFRINNLDIILTDAKRNAQITSAKSFREENDIIISIIENENQLEENQHILVEIIPDIDDKFGIPLDELLGKEFEDESLLLQLNAWANEKKFNLFISEGMKKLKKGFKRTLSCNVKNCGYRLVFKSETGEVYSVDQNLSQKYAKHSMLLFY